MPTYKGCKVEYKMSNWPENGFSEINVGFIILAMPLRQCAICGCVDCVLNCWYLILGAPLL